jgi:hypothetical protein
VPRLCHARARRVLTDSHDVPVLLGRALVELARAIAVSAALRAVTPNA